MNNESQIEFIFGDNCNLDLVNRGVKLEKTLPSQVKEVTLFAPSSIVHSNIFMFTTKDRFFLNQFKIQSKWMPSSYDLYFSGEALNSFDARVILHLVKAMESRKPPSEKMLENMVNAALLQDSSYQYLTPREQMVKEEIVRNKILSLEGIFLNQQDFYNTVKIFKTGTKDKQNLERSIKKLGRSSLEIKSKLQSGGKPAFERNSALINYTFLPDTGDYFISFPPSILEMFKLQTSMINTKVMMELKKKGARHSQGDNPQMFSLLVSYKREQVAKISTEDLMMKSPHYLLKLQSEGKIPKGTIISEKYGTMVGEKGLSLQAIKTQIFRQRKAIDEFFELMRELKVVKDNIQFAGKGNKRIYTFSLNKKLEDNAGKEINLRKLKGESISPVNLS